MKRARLMLVAGLMVGMVVMAQIGQEKRPAIPTATASASPPTPHPEARGESSTPLEAEVRRLVGVRGVSVVISTGGTVYMEIDVLEGYAAQPFAEALLDVARRYGEVIDFSAVLHDGVRVPAAFVWRDGAWNGVQMEQQATLMSATATRQPISVPTSLPVQTRAMVPGNCSTAVAMHLSAVEAAQYGNLDRDNDGVACYGD